MGKKIEVRRGPILPRNESLYSEGMVEYLLTAKSFIHVGSGEGSREFTDRNIELIKKKSSVVDNFDSLLDQVKGQQVNKFYTMHSSDPSEKARFLAIPGSTMKGAVRSNVELLLKSNEYGIVPTCFIVEDKRYSKSKTYRHRNYYDYGINEKISPRGTCRISKIYRNSHLKRNETCLACQLFGKMGLKGLLEFSPAVSECTPNDAIIKEQLYGGSLELAPKGTTFIGRVYFKNITEEMLALIVFIGFRLRKEKQLSLGYRKYSKLKLKDGSAIPMGNLRPSIRKIRIGGNLLAKKEELRSFYAKLKDKFKPAMEKIGEYRTATPNPQQRRGY